MSSKSKAVARRHRTRSATKRDNCSNADRLASVIPILTSNHASGIVPKTLCRLEQVCRATRVAVAGANGDDSNSAWKVFCCNRWPSTAYVGGTVAELGGYKTFYRHRNVYTPKPVRPPHLPLLPQPDLTLDDLVITVDIFDVDGNAAISHALTRDNLHALVKDGEVTCFFKPQYQYVLGSAKCFFSGGEHCACSPRCKHSSLEGEDKMLYNPKVLLVNRKTSSTCSLYDFACACEWSRPLGAVPIGDPAMGKYDWKGESSEAWVAFDGDDGLPFDGEKGLPLQQTRLAGEIFSRLQKKPIMFSLSIGIGVLEPGYNIGMTGFSLSFEVGKLYRGVFDQMQQKKYGVSLMNILDQLEGVVITPKGPMRLSSVNGPTAGATPNDDSSDEDMDSSSDGDW